MVKNCDRGLENTARGRRPRAAFSRPRSQFFTIRTSQPANNIYLFARVKEIGPRQNTRVVNAHSCLSTKYSFLPLVLCSSSKHTPSFPSLSPNHGPH